MLFKRPTIHTKSNTTATNTSIGINILEHHAGVRMYNPKNTGKNPEVSGK